MIRFEPYRTLYPTGYSDRCPCPDFIHFPLPDNDTTEPAEIHIAKLLAANCKAVMIWGEDTAPGKLRALKSVFPFRIDHNKPHAAELKYAAQRDKQMKVTILEK